MSLRTTHPTSTGRRQRPIEQRRIRRPSAALTRSSSPETVRFHPRVELFHLQPRPVHCPAAAIAREYSGCAYISTGRIDVRIAHCPSAAACGPRPRRGCVSVSRTDKLLAAIYAASRPSDASPPAFAPEPPADFASASPPDFAFGAWVSVCRPRLHQLEVGATVLRAARWRLVVVGDPDRQPLLARAANAMPFLRGRWSTTHFARRSDGSD